MQVELIVQSFAWEQELNYNMGDFQHDFEVNKTIYLQLYVTKYCWYPLSFCDAVPAEEMLLVLSVLSFDLPL
jgi:hypothetical protein